MRSLPYETVLTRKDGTSRTFRIRGFGLQQLFFGLREEAAKELGAAEALTTISPDNAYSLVNALASGYTVVTETELYCGLRRYILRKTFSEPAP